MRRDELYGSSSDAEGHSQADAEEDAEVRAKLNERLSSLLGLDLSSAAQPSGSEQPVDLSPQVAGADEEEQHEDKAEEEFEFRLFSTSSKAAAPVKVVLAASDDEDADLGEGAFTVPERPSSYYFAGEPTPEQLQMFRQSAMAGDDIVLGARKRAWGLERPWRIIRIGGPAKSVKQPAVQGSVVRATTATSIVTAEGDHQKRKRPGKKRRIATRIKAKAEKEKREAAEKQKMTKEEHLKEKKKRLNREKKLKRRAKEREQKLAGKSQDGSQPTVSNPADSGSDDDDDDDSVA